MLQFYKQLFYKKIAIAALFLFVSTQCAIAQKSVHNYFNKYKPLAAQLSVKYGIPMSIILGVAVIESGAGKDRNPKLLHNHFGIVGKNNLLKTQGIKTKFKAYATDEDSFIAFSKMITRKSYYEKLKDNQDYNLWLNAMAKAGYSTTPLIWKKQIGNAIKRYRLDTLTAIANIPNIE
ncbi:MAG: glucosaminidase domain-containing protein [Bacteroidetes bacterium]|nr:glucosaminidase domain-containing protein [Bacteroidota bacterium]MBS1649842.1 glucosaminidase domain-containing protein [Bacteroidota bacterium]